MLQVEWWCGAGFWWCGAGSGGAVQVSSVAVQFFCGAAQVLGGAAQTFGGAVQDVSYTHLRAHETREDRVCRLLLEKKKNQTNIKKAVLN